MCPLPARSITLALTWPHVLPPLQQGILDKYNVELIGAKLPSIDKAEDRDLFKQAGRFIAHPQMHTPHMRLLTRQPALGMQAPPKHLNRQMALSMAFTVYG